MSLPLNRAFLVQLWFNSNLTVRLCPLFASAGCPRTVRVGVAFCTAGTQCASRRSEGHSPVACARCRRETRGVRQHATDTLALLTPSGLVRGRPRAWRARRSAPATVTPIRCAKIFQSVGDGERNGHKGLRRGHRTALGSAWRQSAKCPHGSGESFYGRGGMFAPSGRYKFSTSVAHGHKHGSRG